MSFNLRGFQLKLVSSHDRHKFCTSLFSNVSSRFQYEQLNEGSEEKLSVLREIKETLVHRKHLDSSIDFIGKLLFGFVNGPSVLEYPRNPGQPLVDDWDCLKRKVSLAISYLNLNPIIPSVS
jgi:hypothetical protein